MKIFSTFLSLLFVMVLVSCGSSGTDTYADGNSSNVKFASNTSSVPSTKDNQKEKFRNDMEVELISSQDQTRSDESIEDRRDRNKKKKEARAKAKQEALDSQHTIEPQEHLKSENAIKRVAVPEFQTKVDGQTWSSSDVNSFNRYCAESMENTQFDGAKYCDCLLGIMRDTYAPANMSKAVNENPKAMSCLKVK